MNGSSTLDIAEERSGGEAAASRRSVLAGPARHPRLSALAAASGLSASGITFVLSGALEHADNLGNFSPLPLGAIQQ